MTLGGAILGLAAQYVAPHRHTRGVLMAPAIGAVVASAIWAALTWAGWKFDGGWIWVASLVAAGVISIVVTLVVGRSRNAADDAMLTRLSRA